MNRRSFPAAATRAASAALTRPQDEDFDRYLLIDDTDEDASEISILLRACSPRGLEIMS
jgi:hypothetical protein